MRPEYGPPISTSAAEVSRNFARYQDHALTGPVVVTYHGRRRVVVVSAEEYEFWQRQSEAGPIGPNNTQDDNRSGVPSLIAQMPLGFMSFDDELRISEANAVAESYLGLSRDHMIGQLLTDRFPKARNSLLSDRLRRVLKTGMPDIVEGMSIGLEDRSVRNRLFPFLGGVAVLFEDLTEDDRYQALLARMNAIDSLFSKESAAALVELNIRGTVTVASDRLGAVMGLPTERIVGQSFADLFALSDRRALRASIDGVLQGREAELDHSPCLLTNTAEIPVQLMFARLPKGQDARGAVALLIFSTSPSPAHV